MVHLDTGAPAAKAAAVRFASFILLPNRALYRDGQPVATGGRALDLLTAIVLAKGEVVSGEALMQAAWPGRIVVENALHQHIRALRQALGDDARLIQTVSGRGYRLTALIEAQAEEPADSGRPARPPRTATPIVGRERELAQLEIKLKSDRCVTVVGGGGVGKTRLVTEVAMRWMAKGGEAAWCDLSDIEGGERLPAALARALGLPESLVDATGRRAALALGDRELLLVLNNCEQVAEACAGLVANLLERCGGLRVLASSQRPLGLSLESRLVLGPLALPRDGDGAGERADASPAVQLLRQRAESLGAVVLSHADHVSAVALARRLEGNPLGLELAAARVAALGWGATVQALADHFRLLSGVGHAALARHRSLDAAIAWGFGLLTDVQRMAWRSLAVFRGGWTLEAAQSVVAELLPGRASAAELLADLVDHSMIQRDPDAVVPRFKMHEVYRSHAQALSGPGPDWATLAHRHAGYMASWLETQAVRWDTMPDAEWLACTGADMQNVEAAVQCALDSGDADLAARLLCAGFGLWRTRDLLPSLLSLTSHPLLAARLIAEAAGRIDAGLHLVHALALLGESSDGAALASAAHLARRSADHWLDTIARVQARLCLASVYARAGQGEAQSAIVSEAADLLGTRRKGRTYGWLCTATAWEWQLKGDLAAALDSVLEARVAWGAIGAWLDEGRAMIHTADLRLAMGDAAAAVAIGHEAIAWFEGRLQRTELGRAMVNLGAAYAAQGDDYRARELLSSGLHALNGQDFSYWAFDHLAALAAAMGELRWAAKWIGHADAGYARHRAGRRLTNESRARDSAMALLTARMGTDELRRLMAIGAAADETDMVTSVAVLDVGSALAASERRRR